eukprot:GHVS01002305.1.p1 GENE.GHVS01002305.1~~GHVS01002305.1.p1  ORF type:complete len:1006 (-),score=168.47 GHVS01002305.1:1790-4807(-)
MIGTMDAQGDSSPFLDFPEGSPEKAPGCSTVPVPTVECLAVGCQSPPFAAFRLGPLSLEKDVAVVRSSAAVDPPSSEACTEAYEKLLDYILHRTNIVEDTDELLRCIAKIDMKTKATLIPLVEPYLDPNNGAIYVSRGEAAETPPQAEMETNAEAMYGNHLTNFSLYVFQKPTFIGSVQDALRSFRLCPDTPPACRAMDRPSPSPTSEKCGGRPSPKGARLREKKPSCPVATVVPSPRVPRPSEPLFWRALAHLHLFSVVHGSNEVSSSLVVPRLVQLEDFLQEVEYLLRESRRFGFLAATMAMKAVTQWVPWLIWGSKEKMTTKPISEYVSNNDAGLRSTPEKKTEGSEYVGRWCQGVVLDLVDFSSSHFVARGGQSSNSYHAFSELDVMLYVHLLTSMTEILYHPIMPAFIISYRPQTVERLLAASVQIFSSTVLQSLAGTPSLLKITHPLLYILIRLLTAQAPADEGTEHKAVYCSEETNKERRGLIGMKLLGPAAGACSNCNELATAMCEGVYGLCAQPARGGRLGFKEGPSGEESSESNKEMVGCYWSPPEKLVWWLIMKRCLEQGQPLDGDKLLRLLNSAFETMCMKYLLGQGERPKEELKTITAPSQSAEGSNTTQRPGVVAGNVSTSDDRKEGRSGPGTEDSSEDRLFSRQFCCNCWTPLAFSTASSESSSAAAAAVPVDAVSDVLPYELAALLQQLASLHYTMLTAAAAVDSTREAGQQTCKNEVEENRLEDVDVLVRDIMNTGQKGRTGVLGAPTPRKANINKCGGKKGKHDVNRNNRTTETRLQDGGLEVKPEHEIGGGEPGAVTVGMCGGDGLFRSGGDRLRGICGAGLVYPWAVRAMRAVVAEKGVAMAAAGAERNVVVEGEATEENGEKVDDVVVMVQKREADEKLGEVMNGHNSSEGMDREETSEPTTDQQADKHNIESKEAAHTTEGVSGNGGVVSSAGVVKVEGPALIVRCPKCSSAMYCSRRCLEMHQPLHACVCVPPVCTVVSTEA